MEANVNACRRFFELEVNARLVTAGLIELGIDNVNETPDVCNLPDTQTWNKQEKKQHLRKLATTIVDNYVLDKEKHDKFVTACKELEIKDNRRTDITSDGRYMCRFPGCKSTFAKDGQSRRSHELKHTPPVVISEDVQPDTYFEDKHEDFDDMFSYQKALMEYGMLVANLRDAISEGTYISSQYIQHTLNTRNFLIYSMCLFIF